MVECEAPCVQRLTFEWNRAELFGAVRIPDLADQHVSAKPGLDSDLVSFARVQSYFDEARRLETFDHPVIANRLGGARISRVGFL